MFGTIPGTSVQAIYSSILLLWLPHNQLWLRSGTSKQLENSLFNVSPGHQLLLQGSDNGLVEAALWNGFGVTRLSEQTAQPCQAAVPSLMGTWRVVIPTLALSSKETPVFSVSKECWPLAVPERIMGMFWAEPEVSRREKGRNISTKNKGAENPLPPRERK